VFKMTLRVRRAVLALCLPLLLLTHQGAWTHSLAHLVSPSAAQVPADDGHGGKPNSCGLCLVFASLDGGATLVTLALPAVADLSSSVSRFTAPLPARDSATPYFSRAPPVLG